MAEEKIAKPVDVTLVDVLKFLNANGGGDYIFLLDYLNALKSLPESEVVARHRMQERDWTEAGVLLRKLETKLEKYLADTREFRHRLQRIQFKLDNPTD